MRNNTKNKFIVSLSIIAIAIAIPATVLLSQNRTNSQQDAAMKMPMSPMPSNMPKNGKEVIVHIIHKGMSMGGGGGMNGMNAAVEESDSDVDTTVAAAISPTGMQMGNNNGNMGGNKNMCGNMHDMFFSPKVVTISVGTTVKWINDDTDMKHTTTSIRRRGAETWDSGDLKPGESFTHTFTHTGVYPYDCDIHPWMRGVVRVMDNVDMSPMPSHMPKMSGMPKPSHMPMSPMPSGM